MNRLELQAAYKSGERDFSNAELQGENLSYLTLRGANLQNANLSGADCTGVDFTQADLSGARMTLTQLPMADLSGARVTHHQLDQAVTDTSTNMRNISKPDELINRDWIEGRRNNVSRNVASISRRRSF